MSNGQITVKSDSLYTIDVNGIKDLIKIDLTDMSLPAKLINMQVKVEESKNKFNSKIEKILAQEDKILDNGLNQKTLDCLNALNDMCNDLRIEVDKLLGKGVCEAIFGERNTYTMFNDLFDALKPELEKAMKKGNISMKSMRQNLISKYQPKNEDVLQ